MAELNIYKVIEPDSCYKKFLEKGLRPDGRDWHTSRLMTVRVGSVSTADGSATVRLGNTTVICGIKAELCCPTLEQPDRGFVVPNVELHPCCSPLFKAGPPGEKAISTSVFLQNLLQNTRIVDHKELCIVPNKLSWCLYVDVVCVDYDGNLPDVCVMAMVAALLHVTLPNVTRDDETEVISVNDEHRKSLTVKDRPVCTSFGIYDNEIQVLDPSAADECECRGEVRVVLLQDGSVASTSKTGGPQVSSSQLERFISVASERLAVLQQCLEEALQHHALANLSIER